MNKETILDTFALRRGGRVYKVEQVHGGRSRQDIFYRVDGIKCTSDKFHKLGLKVAA